MVSEGMTVTVQAYCDHRSIYSFIIVYLPAALLLILSPTCPSVHHCVRPLIRWVPIYPLTILSGFHPLYPLPHIPPPSFFCQPCPPLLLLRIFCSRPVFSLIVFTSAIPHYLIPSLCLFLFLSTSVLSTLFTARSVCHSTTDHSPNPPTLPSCLPSLHRPSTQPIPRLHSSPC